VSKKTAKQQQNRTPSSPRPLTPPAAAAPVPEPRASRPKPAPAPAPARAAAKAPPTREQVALRARDLWDAAGRPEGRDLEFWYAAERALSGK
jgi:hypothetical protein